MQRIIYACKYGDCYYENKDRFDQFLNLKQGKLTVDEYSNELFKLQEVCGLDENEEHDLKVETLCRRFETKRTYKYERYKDMYEAFWEAIHVECLIKCYHL